MEASSLSENHAGDLHHRMGLSNIAALMHFIRSNIGAGVLSIPWAISHVGYVAGPLLLLGFVLLTFTTLLRLVECANLYSRKVGVPCLDYGDVAYYSILFGPIKGLRQYARIGRITINLSIALLQLSVCCVYYVFVAQNIRQVLIMYWPGAPEDRVFIAMLWVPLTLITFNRNLSGLAWVSTIGNLFIVAALLMIVRYLSTHLQSVDEIPLAKPIEELPMFFSTVAFTFEGVATVLPLENSMRSRKSFRWVYAAALGCLGSVAIVIGEMGYFAFGSSVCGTMSLNLPNNMYSNAVRILMALVVLCGYPLQFYVQMELIWPAIEKRLQPNNRCCELMTKIGISTLLCVFALAIPFLGSVVALTGSLLTAPLQFIYPSLINLMTLSHFDESTMKNDSEVNERMPLQSDQMNYSENRVSEHAIHSDLTKNPMKLLSALKSFLTVIFGVIVAVLGMISSISNIIHNYQTISGSSTCRGGVSYVSTKNLTAGLTMSLSIHNNTTTEHV